VVADSNWELGAEGSDVEHYYEDDDDEEKEQQKQQLQASAKLNQRLQQVADHQPGDRLKEGTQIFILLLVQQKLDHEILFHALDLTVINIWILLSSCGAKYTDRDFRLLLVRN